MRKGGRGGVKEYGEDFAHMFRSNLAKGLISVSNVGLQWEGRDRSCITYSLGSSSRYRRKPFMIKIMTVFNDTFLFYVVDLLNQQSMPPCACFIGPCN